MVKYIYVIVLFCFINLRMINNKLDEVFNELFMLVESFEFKFGKNNVLLLIKWIGKDYFKVFEFI